MTGDATLYRFYMLLPCNTFTVNNFLKWHPSFVQNNYGLIVNKYLFL